jgi:hypothetical protein
VKKRTLTPKQRETKQALRATVEDVLPGAKILVPVKHRQRDGDSIDFAGRHHTELRARADAWLAQQAHRSADEERGPDTLDAAEQHYARLVHMRRADVRGTMILSPGTHKALGARG